MEQYWETCTPEEVGISSQAVLDFLYALELGEA